MAHQCERPACAEPAAVAYGYDPSRGVAWLEVFVATDPHHGRLCRRHAETMVVPQGWWLEDRRSADQLFASPGADGTSERPRRNGRSRRPAVVIDLPVSNRRYAAVGSESAYPRWRPRWSSTSR